MSRQYLLIDGKNLLFRAAFASPNLKTRDGRYSGAIHGFIKMLCRIRIQNPDAEFVVLWEQAGQKTYRHKLLPGYKDRGVKSQEDEFVGGIHLQIGAVREFCKVVGMRWVELPAIEADDLAGLLTVSLRALDHEILLLSGDKDWWQLAPIPGVTVLCEQGVGKNEPTLSDERVMEAFGVKAKDLLRFRPFIGDTSDKIPPCRPRFFKKHALMLVAAGVNPKWVLEDQPSEVLAFPLIREIWPNYIRNYKLMKIARSLDECGVSVEAFNGVMNAVTYGTPAKDYRALIRVLADWELEDAMQRRTFIFALASAQGHDVQSSSG